MGMPRAPPFRDGGACAMGGCVSGPPIQRASQLSPSHSRFLASAALALPAKSPIATSTRAGLGHAETRRRPMSPASTAQRTAPHRSPGCPAVTRRADLEWAPACDATGPPRCGDSSPFVFPSRTNGCVASRSVAVIPCFATHRAAPRVVARPLSSSPPTHPESHRFPSDAPSRARTVWHFEAALGPGEPAA